MGQIKRPHKVKLITALLSNDIEALERVKKILQRIFGRIDFESALLDFSHTDYYKEELGDNLKRKFFSFERLRDPGTIYKVKIRTNRRENRFLRGGKRTVNIDPGYLDLSKLILFSTKDYSHRIYLNKGIFAENTLFYRDKSYNPWPWTYPDYKTAEYIDMFNSIRQMYKNTKAAYPIW